LTRSQLNYYGLLLLELSVLQVVQTLKQWATTQVQEPKPIKMVIGHLRKTLKEQHLNDGIIPKTSNLQKDWLRSCNIACVRFFTRYKFVA
jgi:hypothetical protein